MFPSMQSVQRPPSQSLYETLVVAQNPIDLFEQMRELGTISYLPVGVSGRPTYWLFEPEAVEHVLVRNRKNYVKDRTITLLDSTIGRGLLITEGDEWKAQRKTMAPAFHHRALQGYAEAMVRRTDELVDEWSDGEVFELNQMMMHLTLRIVLDCLFSTSIGRDERIVGECLDTVMDYYSTAIPRLVQIPLWVPTPLNRRFRDAVAQLDQIVFRMIRERQASGEQLPDLLGLLLASRDENDEGMPEDILRDQVMTLMLAGHETTAQTLTYTLWLLDRHPEVAERARASVFEAVGDEAPGFADTRELGYLEQIVSESMRLYPPAPVVGREALEDDEILGWQIPAGSQIAMPQWCIHRDERFFPDPLTFRPERWTPEMRAELPRFAYFPFGGGNRVCIGDRFAMMEATLVLARLLQRVQIEDLDKKPLTLQPSVTLRPGNEIRVRGRAR